MGGQEFSGVSSGSVFKSAALMGAATFISRIMGLVREQVFAFLFGAGNATDAFNIAFRIPNLLRDLFAEGAMSAALVPTFTRVRIEEGDRRAWRVAGLVFRVLGVVVSVLAIIGFIFAPQLVELYASAYREVPGKFELTVTLTRIIFPFFPLVALAAAFMGILNACGVFFLPAFASALFNIVSVVTGVALYFVCVRTSVEPIIAMAVGVVAGGIVQAGCQLPALYRAGYKWVKENTPNQATWSRDPALKTMLWMILPGTIGLAATQVNILVNSVLATSQGPGAVSWLNYAFRLMQFPIGVFGVSLAAATLPRVSKLWVMGDLAGVRDNLRASLGQVFAINLPASAGLAFLAVPILELIFQYGRFSASDTQATAQALMAYSVGLAAYSGVKVLVPAFYAMGNTRIPVVSSILSVALTIALNVFMVQKLGYWGLALGTSIAAIFNFAFLLGAIRGLLRKGGGDFPVAPIARSFAVHLGVALLMGGVCFTLSSWLKMALPEPETVFGVVGIRLLRVAVLMLVGGLFVGVFAQVFKIRETSEVVGYFWKKLAGRFFLKKTQKIR